MNPENRTAEEIAIIEVTHPKGDVELEIIDIEIFAIEGKSVPHGKKYRVKIDKTYYETTLSEMNGAQILELAGKTSDKFLLRQKARGQMHPVLPDQEVDFVHHGVERFVTVPKEVTEGEADTRRNFVLIEEDANYLESLSLPWEAVDDGQMKRIVIRGIQIPDGYNQTHADVFVIIPSGYPDVQIDMAYFFPALMRKDGRAIDKTPGQDFDGRSWQGWSRHRTANSAWRPGIDNLETHMALVQSFLNDELKK
jgi:hypothetical protein